MAVCRVLRSIRGTFSPLQLTSTDEMETYFVEASAMAVLGDEVLGDDIYDDRRGWWAERERVKVAMA